MPIKIDVDALEFDQDGRTLWVHAKGATVLRVQLPLGTTFHAVALPDYANPVSHGDIAVQSVGVLPDNRVPIMLTPEDAAAVGIAPTLPPVPSL